jgi:hypothetical protein
MDGEPKINIRDIYIEEEKEGGRGEIYKKGRE